MTSSRKALVREMDAEARLFWSAMTDMNAMARAGIPLHAPEMQDALGEIEAIECNTAWPRLKRACAATLALLAPVEALAMELADDVLDLVDAVASVL